MIIFYNIYEVAKRPIGWVVGIFYYFLPIGGIFEVLLIVCGLDLVTGLYASYLNKEPISSRRLRQSVVKLLCYMGAIVTLFKAENEFLGGVEIASYKFIAGFIFLVEFISVLENMAVITGNKIFL